MLTVIMFIVASVVSFWAGRKSATTKKDIKEVSLAKTIGFKKERII